MKGIERGEERGGDDRGQARPEPPGWEDKRQRWRHFMVTISTCPSVAATGTTQPCTGWQGAANLSGDKTKRQRIMYTHKQRRCKDISLNAGF